MVTFVGVLPLGRAGPWGFPLGVSIRSRARTTPPARGSQVVTGTGTSRLALRAAAWLASPAREPTGTPQKESACNDLTTTACVLSGSAAGAGLALSLVPIGAATTRRP